MPSQYTTIHKIDAGLLSDDKYDVMMAMIGDKKNKTHIHKQTPIFKGKEVMPIKHTKEQEAQIALKRLKKNKKKQAKKNKKNKKKTKKKTSKEHIDELNAEFQTAMDEHTKEIYRKLEICEQQKKGAGPWVFVVD
mgnify:CR=1 FL=1